MNALKIPCALFLGMTLVAWAALAHDVHLFAAFEGEVVHGRAYFAGGDAAAGLTVNVFTKEGMPLGASETDAEGRFTYVPEQEGPLRFVVETLDGHRASLTVAFVKDEVSEDIDIEYHTPSSVEFQEIIERAVAHEVAPVLEELDRLENRIRFRDVLGGLGYIVGVMGLIVFWKARSWKGRP